MILVIRQFFPKDYVGLCLWPFIILREKTLLNDQVLINHERIHLQQQWELGILPFYIWYFTEWLWKCLLYQDTYLFAMAKAGTGSTRVRVKVLTPTGFDLLKTIELEPDAEYVNVLANSLSREVLIRPIKQDPNTGRLSVNFTR